jgi:hypothetical protein
MSIVTTAQAVPSRLFSIYASLYGNENGEPRERIEAWATPPSLGSRGVDEDGESSTTLFTNTLLEARKLGLVEEVDGRLRLSADARGLRRKGGDPEASFRGYMLRTLFDPTRAAEAQQNGFMLALAWFLTTNPLNPMSFSDGPQNQLKAEIADSANKTELTSINRYQNFLYWARYLGFATILGGRDSEEANSRRVIPDPVRAITSVLPAIFENDDELAIEAFMGRLAAIFPVFEGGAVRQDYEAMRLNPRANSDHRLSIATSIALQRLADRQTVVLTSIADAATLIFDFGGDEGRFSHIARRDAA